MFGDWGLVRLVLFVFCFGFGSLVARHTSHVTRHTSHVTRHSFDLRLWVLVLGFGYALCILMNISYYRYSIVGGGVVFVVCCLGFKV